MLKTLERIKERLRRLPSPLLGLSLGVTGLCAALEHAAPTGFWLPAGCALTVPLAFIVLLKLALHRDILREDLRHPVLGTLPVAASMVLMQGAMAVRAAAPAFSVALWLFAMFLSFAGCAAFFYVQIRERKKENLLPSFFVAFGGMLVGAMTVPRPEWAPAAIGIMLAGDIAFFCIFPFVLWRVLFLSPLPEPLKPVCAIFAAPVNLVMASWLATHQEVSALGWMLFALAVVLNLWVYAMLPGLLRLPFYPSRLAHLPLGHYRHSHVQMVCLLSGVAPSGPGGTCHCRPGYRLCVCALCSPCTQPLFPRARPAVRLSNKGFPTEVPWYSLLEQFEKVFGKLLGAL